MQKRDGCRVRVLAVISIFVIVFSTQSLTIAPHSILFDSGIHIDEPHSLSLTPHDPISITSDDDFERHGFEGNGSEVSPYLIKNLLIDNDDEGFGIKIVSTSVYFIIENCELLSSDEKTGVGIYFEKVVNGAVLGCIIHTLSVGISVLKSELCEFSGNQLFRLETGIYATQSLWLSIEGNEMTNCGYGIHLEKIDYSDIVGNHADECDYGILIITGVEIQTRSNNIRSSIFGIYFHNSLQGSSYDNLVQDSHYGIYIGYSQKCNITSSELTANKFGIYLYEVDTGVLVSNIVESNSDFGIYIKKSRDVSVLSNTVFYNSGVGIYLTGVSGASIHYNEIGYNFGTNAVDTVGVAIRGLVNNWDTNAWSDYAGSSYYRIPGDLGSVDNDPRYIIFLDSPTDATIEAPASGSIEWSASAFRPSYFSIEIDGVTTDEGAWDGDDISTIFTALDPDTYTFVLSITTQSGISVSDEVNIHVQDTTEPEWLQIPEDQVIECGSSVSYQLYASDHYGISGWWVNSSDFTIDNGLLQNVIELQYGVYSLEVRANDPSHNYISQSLSISVVDTTLPTIDSPDDIILSEGETGHLIIWNVFDCNPFSYEIFKDGVSIEFGDWNPGITNIQYSLDGLASGTFVFSVVLTDMANNTVTDEVQVTVEVLTPPTTTTDTETTTTTQINTPTTESSTPTGGEMSGPDILYLGLIGGFASVAVVIAVVVVKRK